MFVSSMDEENGVGNGCLLLALAGIRAEAALYLDGTESSIVIGNMGGSRLHLTRKSALDDATLKRHEELLTQGCQALTQRRSPRYDRPFFTENVTRAWSVRMVSPAFFGPKPAEGPTFVMPFYTFPDEENAAACGELESMAGEALGDELSLYDISYHEPWFEASFTPPETPLVQHVAAAVRDVLHQEPLIGVGSKQDSFVLRNHAGIPTVSFGISHMSGPGKVHAPDEHAILTEAWDGCGIVHDAVARWLREGD